MIDYSCCEMPAVSYVIPSTYMMQATLTCWNAIKTLLLVSRLISKVLHKMILNPSIIPVGVAFVLRNLQSQTVLDLSGTNHISSMSHGSEIR